MIRFCCGIFPHALLIACIVAPPCNAHAAEYEYHRWCLQTKSGTLKQEIAREVIRRLNRRLYLMNPSTQLEREDEDVHITIGVPHGVGAEDSSRTLVEVAVGPVVERENLQDLLDADSLMDRLLRRNYFWIEDTQPAASGEISSGEFESIREISAFKTLKDVNWWAPTDYSLSASYGFARFSERAGMFVEFGNDELGYPLWNSGSFRAGIAHEFVKAWIQSPLIGANTKTFFVQRKLDGAIGAGAAFDVGTAGGEFGFADITETSSSIGILDSSSIHFISALAQIYYILPVSVRAPVSGALRVKFGGGFHEIVTAYVTPETHGKIIKRDRGVYRGGPYLRAEFVTSATQGALPAGEAFLQYYNGSMMVGGAYNFASWFAIEAKCSFIFSPDPWERSVMYAISPRIRI